MKKPNYLGMRKSDLTKAGIYEFSYGYIEPKYQEEAKFCCIMPYNAYQN